MPRRWSDDGGRQFGRLELQAPSGFESSSVIIKYEFELFGLPHGRPTSFGSGVAMQATMGWRHRLGWWLVPAAIGLLLALSLAGAGTVAFITIMRSQPATSGNITLSGLQAPVTVIRDQWGVPHIRAANAHGLFFAQGYVTAQDRLWQMEIKEDRRAVLCPKSSGSRLLRRTNRSGRLVSGALRRRNGSRPMLSPERSCRPTRTE
jgi:Penicillin amidase